MTLSQNTTRYDSTREAWEGIWNGATVPAELEVVQTARSLETIARYRPYLPREAPILEAGSGLSAVVITLRREGYPVIGLDYAVNALQISRAYDSALPLVGGDIHKLPFADDSLGGYLSFGVLEHFEHGLGPGLAEAWRVLQPGGVLVLTIPYPNLVYRLVQWKRRLTGSGPLTDERFYESAYTRQALVQAVEDAGFRLALAAPTSHSFTLRGLGGPFRGPGYYNTSPLAEAAGRLVRRIAPWPFNYMTLVVAHK